MCLSEIQWVCVCACVGVCVRACVRVCVRVCMCEIISTVWNGIIYVTSHWESPRTNFPFCSAFLDNILLPGKPLCWIRGKRSLARIHQACQDKKWNHKHKGTRATANVTISFHLKSFFYLIFLFSNRYTPLPAAKSYSQSLVFHLALRIQIIDQNTKFNLVLKDSFVIYPVHAHD